MKVIEFAPAYGIKLYEARRFTEDEKTRYAEWFRELGLVAIAGTGVNLDEISWQDLPKDRESCGSFLGCDNYCYEITDEEWQAYIDLNSARAAEKERKKRNNRIAELKMELEKLHGAVLYTKEEAECARRFWINGINEGGEGFVPHFWTKDEVEDAKKELERLLAEAGMSNALSGAGS